MLLLCGAILFAGDFSEDAIRQSIRVTAGSSLLLFTAAFSASSLGQKNWKRLHKLGGYLVFVGLFSSYVGGALQKGYAYYWLYSALCLALLSLRISAFWNKPKAAYA